MPTARQKLRKKALATPRELDRSGRPHFGPPVSKVARAPVLLKTEPYLPERQRVRSLTRYENDVLDEIRDDIKPKEEQRRRHHKRLRRAGWRQLPNGEWERPRGNGNGGGKKKVGKKKARAR